MKMLLRVLHAEVLKLKRTIALKMVVLAPAVIVLLVLFIASQAPFSMVNRYGAHEAWLRLLQINLRLWALLMMPLLIALESALVASVDHSQNQWKSLMARPVPRWSFYVAKLIVVAAMTAASSVVLLCGILMDGAILPHIQPELVFGFPLPWGPMLHDWAYVTGLAFLALTLQHWVSLRWRSFSVAIGTGIVATVTGFFAALATAQIGGGWPRYFPWSLPMLTLADVHPNLNLVLCAGFISGTLVAIAGCLDFCRLEVQ
jgi:lantibiotic transport system permease protein